MALMRSEDTWKKPEKEIWPTSPLGTSWSDFWEESKNVQKARENSKERVRTQKWRGDHFVNCVCDVSNSQKKDVHRGALGMAAVFVQCNSSLFPTFYRLGKGLGIILYYPSIFLKLELYLAFSQSELHCGNAGDASMITLVDRKAPFFGLLILYLYL